MLRPDVLNVLNNQTIHCSSALYTDCSRELSDFQTEYFRMHLMYISRVEWGTVAMVTSYCSDCYYEQTKKDKLLRCNLQ